MPGRKTAARVNHPGGGFPMKVIFRDHKRQVSKGCG